MSLLTFYRTSSLRQKERKGQKSAASLIMEGIEMKWKWKVYTHRNIHIFDIFEY